MILSWPEKFQLFAFFFTSIDGNNNIYQFIELKEFYQLSHFLGQSAIIVMKNILSHD